MAGHPARFSRVLLLNLLALYTQTTAPAKPAASSSGFGGGWGDGGDDWATPASTKAPANSSMIKTPVSAGGAGGFAAQAAPKSSGFGGSAGGNDDGWGDDDWGSSGAGGSKAGAGGAGGAVMDRDAMKQKQVRVCARVGVVARTLHVFESVSCVH